jgi:hypothetical protein
MSFLSHLRRSNFLIKLGSWEYWPFGVVQAPLFPYWIWLSLKARSLVFSNPGILMGGMFGESKAEVLMKVPEHCKPKTALVHLPATKESVDELIRTNGFRYPVIFKPDLGERGWMVKKIRGIQDIEVYLQNIRIDFIIQEYVDLPLEYGVFYIRYPSEPTGKVTSIVGKEMLSVTGDGKKSLEQLILETDRAKLQYDVLKVLHADQWSRILAVDERFELVSVGNHCLGTKFLNKNQLITDRLSESFDMISQQIPGFYFGRFDLRTASEADLEKGQVMVMELNGCGAEPAHIYQPGYSFWKALGVLFKHWHDIFRISAENHKRGVAYLSFSEARSIYKTFKMGTAR